MLSAQTGYFFSLEKIKPAIALRLSNASCSQTSSSKVWGVACTPLPLFCCILCWGALAAFRSQKVKSGSLLFSPAISPSLNDPLPCRCAYYIFIFWSCATKTRERGQAKSPLWWGRHWCHHWDIKPHHQLLQRDHRRCSMAWFLEEGLPRSPFCPGFYSPSLLALFLLTRRPVPTTWAPLESW